jgi:hypothetical protein
MTTIPAQYSPDYDTAARALPDGLLDAAHAASHPGPWREAIRRETDRRYMAARMDYAAIMETPTT